ncbi:hypothetical protein [Humibacter sp.]|uniref:hypothetical protein n=1 Tax=Humibacter sp. TaxID=1940291 RepID=UPI003F7DF7E3
MTDKPTRKARPIQPPAGLSDAGRGLWRQIATDWRDNDVVPDAREARLLTDACHEADVLALLEAELATAAATGSLTTTGSMGQLVTHPHVGEARRSRAQIKALLQALQLDVPEANVDAAVTKLTNSQRARKAAQARWARAHG